MVVGGFVFAGQWMFIQRAEEDDEVVKKGKVVK